MDKIDTPTLLNAIEYTLSITLIIALFVCSLIIPAKKGKNTCPECKEKHDKCCCEDFKEECFNMED